MPAASLSTFYNSTPNDSIIGLHVPWKNDYTPTIFITLCITAWSEVFCCLAAVSVPLFLATRTGNLCSCCSNPHHFTSVQHAIQCWLGQSRYLSCFDTRNVGTIHPGKNHVCLQVFVWGCALKDTRDRERWLDYLKKKPATSTCHWTSFSTGMERYWGRRKEY